MSGRKEGPINILKSRAELARKAYGVALFELFQCLKVHEEYGGARRGEESPEPYDGAVGGMNATDELIFAYLTLMQAERDEDAGRVIDHEPLDRLVTASDG
jgi:hypothetical protein